MDFLIHCVITHNCYSFRCSYGPNMTSGNIPSSQSLCPWTYVCHSWAHPCFLAQGIPRPGSGKESTCQCRRCEFDPWVWKIPWKREWLSTPVFLPGESHGQRKLMGHSPWGHKESDLTERPIWKQDFLKCKRTFVPQRKKNLSCFSILKMIFPIKCQKNKSGIPWFLVNKMKFN